MKKTSIVCTIGPASNSVEIISTLIKAGMNCARINMSHGTHESLRAMVSNIKKVREKTHNPLALILDTKGPEIRIKTFKNGKITLNPKNDFTLTTREVDGNENEVTLAYKPLISEVKIGDFIFANNGMLTLKVVGLNETDIICKVVYGGDLSNNKGLNIPNIVPKGEYISDGDKSDLRFAVEQDADYIAASFVSNKENVLELRKFIDDLGGKEIKIISKIENNDGVKNIDEILEVSDGIMVARGDLGVEIPLEKLPAIQKKLISKCNQNGKIVIVATEMLESMITSRRPTRAEVSDVAGSIYELTTSTMLSGETAMGKHPVEVVKTMSKIIEEAEKNINYDNNFLATTNKINSVMDAIGEATCSNAVQLKTKAIVVFTTSGNTATRISSHRIKTPIIALCPNKKIYNSLALSFNITPVVCEMFSSEEEMVKKAQEITKSMKLAKSGDLIAIVTGVPKAKGETNMMKIVKI